MTLENALMPLSHGWAGFPRAAAGEGSGAAGEGTAAGGDAQDMTAGEGGESPSAAGLKTAIGGAKPGAGETSEGKGTGSGGEGGTPGAKGDDDGPPADGKYTFTLPEGMELDEGVVEKMSPVLAELGLTNAQAGKLVGTYAELMQGQAEARVAEWTQVNETWLAEAKADKVITNMGWDAAVAHANAALEQFDPEGELSKALAGGAVNGNHPALIRALARVGKGLANDTTETSSANGQAAQTPEDRWYGRK